MLSVMASLSAGGFLALLLLLNRRGEPIPLAYILLQPSYTWVPFNVTNEGTVVSVFSAHGDPRKFQVLSRHKRDFGISAAIAAIVLAVIAATATATVALTQSALTASAFQNLTQAVTSVTTTQMHMLELQHGAIMALQQQIDLLSIELETVWDALRAGCDPRYSHLPICVTPYPVNITGNVTEKLGNWRNWVYRAYDKRFMNMTAKLKEEITQLSKVEVQDISSTFVGFIQDTWDKVKNLLDPSNLFLLAIVIAIILILIAFWKCCLGPRMQKLRRTQNLMYLALSQYDPEEGSPGMIMAALRDEVETQL